MRVHAVRQDEVRCVPLVRVGEAAALEGWRLGAGARAVRSYGGGCAVTPERLEGLRRAYGSAPFVAELGMRLESAGEGVCVGVLDLEPRHLQQDGFVHAGVQMTLADHTAGAAAATVAGRLYKVLTTELSIHLLRPAKGERLECVARVLRPGRLLTVVESEVYCGSGTNRTLVSKATATIANVPHEQAQPLEGDA